jgi:transposase-like protein
MGKKSKLSDTEKLEAVLMLLRKQEPASVLARRYGVSDPTLYRWRDEFLEGGKAALANGKHIKNGTPRRVAELEKQLAERDRVIGELTVANRVLKKLSGDLS